MDDFYPTEPALRGLCASGCGRQDKQLNTYDYLSDVPGNVATTDLVEVQFKNTRKGYYHNDNHLDLVKGDQVAVESNPGHDIGVVTLTGQLVLAQLKKAGLKANNEIRRVYRKARPSDLEKFEEAKAREHQTMIRSRQIAKELELDMKIGDVEFQGDGNKAIFYYIADARVDFRKLIRVLADEFHVRIEMRQIGARQEAGRIGGIGPCGRELCCSTWMKNFQTVSTGAARQQDISPNPQKLAGQCGKLKCCLNYELDAYNEAHKSLPERNVPLETIDGTYYHFKADILSGQITYSTDKRMAANLVTVSAERALEVMEMNRGGEKPETLDNGAQPTEKKVVDLAEQDDLTRFDKSKKRKKRRPRPDNARQTAPEEGQEVGAPNARGGNARRERAPRRNDDRNRERSGNRNDRNRNSRDAEARADQAKGNGRRDQTRPTPNGNSDNTPTA